MFSFRMVSIVFCFLILPIEYVIISEIRTKSTSIKIIKYIGQEVINSIGQQNANRYSKHKGAGTHEQAFKPYHAVKFPFVIPTERSMANSGFLSSIFVVIVLKILVTPISEMTIIKP